MTTISNAIETGIEKLANEEARLESEILLAFSLQKDRAYLYTWPERSLTETQLARYHDYLQRRIHGEPIAYITGKREFWGLNLAVSPATLIPRPETEHLVEIALQKIPANTQQQVADLGTGSGAVALALARERPQSRVVATDISDAALDIARHNANTLQVPNIIFKTSDWFDVIEETEFNVVVSNPPYVASNNIHLSQGDLRFEPPHALASGEDGLQDIRKIVTQARKHLAANGWLILEHGFDQGDQVKQLFQQNGFTKVECFQDYGARERATAGMSPAKLTDR